MSRASRLNEPGELQALSFLPMLLDHFKDMLNLVWAIEWLQAEKDQARIQQRRRDI